MKSEAKYTLTKPSVRWLGGAFALALGCGGDAGATNDDEQESGLATADADGWCEAKAVLDQHCVSCHDGKGTAGTPMGLTRYEDLTAAAPDHPDQKVYERVAFRIHPDNNRKEGLTLMPPDGSLGEADVALLDAWAAAEAPRGDDSACKQAATEETASSTVRGSEGVKWPPEECDEIYQIRAHAEGDLDEPLAVTKDGETDPNSHPQVYMDAPWGDEAVQAIGYRPVTDNTTVLHHWILYDNSSGRGEGGGFLTGWAPGENASWMLPDDVGMDMPAKLRLDLHYFNATGDVAYDQSGVDICVVKGDHRRKYAAGVTMALNKIAFPGLGEAMAPANTANHQATGVCEVETTEPVTLLTASPHSHTYAVHHRFTLTKKDGTEVVMLDAPFQFGEQTSFGLDKPLVIETGDTITTTCTYTNMTSENIYFGDGTDDEMCFNFAMYYPKGALGCVGGFLR